MLRQIFKQSAFKKIQNVFSTRCLSNIIRGPEVQMDDVTIQEYVYKHFHKYPHKIAIECGITGRKYTFEEIRKYSNNFSTTLRKILNLNKGDVVAFHLPNIPEFPIGVLGSLEAGLVVTTINPLYTTEEICRHLEDSNTKAIVTSSTTYGTIVSALKNVKKSLPIITINFMETDATPAGALNFKELMNTKCDIGNEKVNLNTSDLAFLLYSSGTTGLPKAVELTHQNFVPDLYQLNFARLHFSRPTTDTHQDIIPAVLPFFHVYGLATLLFDNMSRLFKVITLPKFTPDSFYNTLINHKPHTLFIVPPLLSFLTSPLIKKEDLSSISTVLSSAAPLGALDEERLLKKADKPLEVLQGYGLTEATPIFVTYPRKKERLGVFGSVGEPVPNTTVKVVPIDDPLGKPLGPNEKGELLVKGPQVMSRYHKRPKETENAFADGWLRTGDLVYYDENEMFYVVDRLKELIKVKGFQVAPTELEEILRSYPDISDAAVIGVPHKTYGEVPRAYVVEKGKAKLNTEKLNEFMSQKVSEFKQLEGGVVVVRSLPKTASGKILRKDLKLHYQNESK